MRIVVISNTSWYLDNFYSGFIAKLKKRGIEIYAIAPHDKFSCKLQENTDGFYDWKLTGTSKNPVVEIASLIRLFSMIKKIEPDYVLSFTPKANIYSAVVSRWLGIKNIANVSGLGNAFIEGGWLKTLVTTLYKIAFSSTNKVFVQNPTDYHLFKELRMANADTLALIPGAGVNTEYFNPTYNYKKDNAFRFLYVGRMLREKGVVEYVNAAKIIKQKYPQVLFLLLGPFSTTNPTALTESEVLDWEENGTVSYLGETSDVRGVLAYSDCIVLPSYREGLPNSLMEAASMEKLSVATDVPGCRDVIEDGETGLLCKAKSAEDLAQKMEEILNLSDLEQKAMSKKARERMIASFDVDIVLEMYLQTLKSL